MTENRWVILDDISASVNISHGSAYHNLHDVLGFFKVSAGSVPQQLTPELKQQRIDACEQLLWHIEQDGDAFLVRIVTRDETWVHYHQPEMKRASKEWRHFSSPQTKDVSNTAISREHYTEPLLGQERCILGALHVARDHYYSWTILWPIKISSSACNQIKTPRIAVCRCSIATWKYMVPYNPCSSCDNNTSWLAFCSNAFFNADAFQHFIRSWVTSFSALPGAEHRSTTHKGEKCQKALAPGKGIVIKSWPWSLSAFCNHYPHQTLPEWLPYVQTTERSPGWQDVLFWWRGMSGTAQVVVHVPKLILFHGNTGTF